MYGIAKCMVCDYEWSVSVELGETKTIRCPDCGIHHNITVIYGLTFTMGREDEPVRQHC